MEKKAIMMMTLTLFLASVLTMALNTKKVEAAEPALISILNTLGFTNIQGTTVETFPAGTYEVTLYAEFASGHASNELSRYRVGTSNFIVIFTGSEGTFGYISPPIKKTFMAADEFGLSFLSFSGDRYFTETTRNPDGVKHALVYLNKNDPSMFLIGFENTRGGGDQDYQDMIISLKKIVEPPVPEFSLSTLIITSIATVAYLVIRRRLSR